MAVLDIDDPRDPRVDDYRRLGDPELARSRGLFVAEGRLVVARAIEDGRYRLRSALVNEAARRALDPVLTRLDPAVPVYVCRAPDIATITGFNIHRGCLAMVERPAPRSIAEVLEGAACVVALDSVTNADNVGGVFRNAAAFGVDGVVLSPTTCDPLYRKAIRTSMGAALAVRFARAARWSEALEALQSRGFALIALTPARTAESLDAFVARPVPSRLAVLVGAEGEGIGSASAAAAWHVRIPTRPEVDSLNLAVATGIALSRLTGGERLTSRTIEQR